MRETKQFFVTVNLERVDKWRNFFIIKILISSIKQKNISVYHTPTNVTWPLHYEFSCKFFPIFSVTYIGKRHSEIEQCCSGFMIVWLMWWNSKSSSNTHIQKNIIQWEREEKLLFFCSNCFEKSKCGSHNLSKYCSKSILFLFQKFFFFFKLIFWL